MADKIKTFLKKFKIWRSFKLRLLIIIFLMGIIPSIIMRLGILENYESRAVAVRISDVQTQLRIIANHLITYNYLQDTSSEVIGAELEQISNLYNGRVLIMKGKNTADYDSVNRFIEITIPIVETVSVPDDNGGEAREKEVVRGVMLTSVSTDTIVNTLDILNRQAIIMGNIMFIFIFALAICLARILVRPFERVTRAISEVKEGYTDEPISVSDYLETEHIVDAFNSLIKRMKTLDDSRQEFVANVSHELKTPITSITVLADSLLAQEDVPAELYHEFMEDIAEEIERENKIINDLLALVKQDKSVAQLNISMVIINELVEIILKRLRPIAKKSNVEVTLISKREIVAEVDEVKMSLILTNLVVNAIKYNKEQGKVEVLLDADHQFFTVRVRDSGIGIPQEALGQIFERFYRVDKSHSREIGGTGLGLAITRSAVQLLRGSIKVESALGEGTAFTVKIPLTRTLV